MSCGLYRCASTTCPTSCTNSNQCDPSAYCTSLVNGTCQLLKSQGASCGASAECGSGSCVDGFCCSGACAGGCQACSNSLTGVASGTCAPILAGSAAKSGCPTTLPATCGTNGLCNGTGSCQNYQSSTPCLAQSCTASVQTNAQTCSGTGTCQITAPTSTSCGSYTCNGTACRTSCATSADCTSTSFCTDASQCSPGVILLAASTGSSMMGTGLVGAEFRSSTSTWSAPTTLTGGVTLDNVALAVNRRGNGVLVIHNTIGMSGMPGYDELWYTTWAPGAATGTWTTALQVLGSNAVGTNTTTFRPAIAVAPDNTFPIAYGDSAKNYRYNFLDATATMLGLTASEVVSTLISNVSAPAIASRSTGPTVTIANASNADQFKDRTGATPWTTALAPIGTNVVAPSTQRPELVTLSSGAMLAAYVQSQTGAGSPPDLIAYSKRSTGVGWAVMTTTIASSSNAVDIALAALPASDMAVVAYRNSSTNVLYTSVYNGMTWSTPVSTGATTLNVPAITHGVQGKALELVYIGTTGVGASHLRCSALTAAGCPTGNWSAPAPILAGMMLSSVAIDSNP